MAEGRRLPFRVPCGSSIRDLELAKNDRICVQNVLPLPSKTPAAQRGELDELEAALIEAGSAAEALNAQENFDRAYSFVRHFDALNSDVKSSLLALLCSTLERLVAGLAAEAERDALVVRNALQITVYFLARAAASAERALGAANTSVVPDGASRTKAAPSKRKKAGRGRRRARADSDEDEDGAAGGASSAKVFDWGSHRVRVFSALLSSLCSPPGVAGAERVWVEHGRLWNCGLPDEEFANVYWRTSESVLVSSSVLKDAKMRSLSLELVAAPVHRFHALTSHSVVSSLSHLLRKHDHAPSMLAELLELLVRSPSEGGYGDDRLAREMLLDVGRINVHEAARDATGIKRVGAFIEEVAARLPALVLSNLSVLLPHLNAEAYPIRVAIVRALGFLVRHLHGITVDGSSVEAGNAEAAVAGTTEGSDKTRDRLLDVMMERAHDVSSWVRAATLRTWGTLCEANALPLSHVHTCTDLACARVRDKSSVVRKQAIALLACLLSHNPYGECLDPRKYLAEVVSVKAWLDEHGYDGEGGAIVDDEEDRGGETAEKNDDEAPCNNAESDDAASSSDAGEDEETSTPVDQDDGVISDAAEIEDEATPEERQRRAKLRFLEYCRSAVGFIARLERCSAELLLLLSSKTTSDVLESVRYFAKARTFEVPGAEAGVRAMLALVWDTRESGAVKKELMLTFDSMYVAVTLEDGSRRRAMPPDVIASNLVDLAVDASLSELTSLEQVVAEAMRPDGVLKRRILPGVALDALWSIACIENDDAARSTVSNAARTRAHAALGLIGMAAAAAPAVVDRPQSIQRLLELGFGEDTRKANDYAMARHALSAMLAACITRRASASKTAASGTNPLCGVEGIVTRVQSVVSGDWDEPIAFVDTPESGAVKTLPVAFVRSQWYPAAEHGIDLLFELAMAKASGGAVDASRSLNAAQGHCACIIRSLCGKVFGGAISPSDSNAEDGNGPLARADPEGLSRLFFVLGHVAVKLLVHAEAVAAFAKRARNERNEAEERRSKNAKKAKRVEGGGGMGVAKADDSDDDGGEFDMLGAAGDDDAEECALNNIANVELVADKANLLGSFAPLIVRVAANEGLARLRQSAVLALCQYMSVSGTMCEKYLRLLFTVLRDAEEPGIRANVMIALGDLAFRFPNTVEPYTSQIYRMLRDADVGVRKNTLMVLTHLILNDMIKVRGEVSEIAVCLEDDDLRIRDLAGLFFSELGKRGSSSNPIYNLLPDALGRLSRDEALDTVAFERVARFLLGFVGGKDKHSEALMEKLCHRIHAATGVSAEGDTVTLDSVRELQQCRDFAFCVAQLKLGDSAVRKISDTLFKLYRPVLADVTVYAHLASVATKSVTKMPTQPQLLRLNLARAACANNKEELKQTVEDWIARLEDTHEGLLADDTTASSAAKSKRDAAKSKKLATARAGRRRGKNANDKVEVPEEEIATEGENVEPNQTDDSEHRAPFKTARRKARSQRRKVTAANSR